MIYLCNTFSVHMFKRMNCGDFADLTLTRISSYEAGKILKANAFRSFFGHTDGASRLESYLHIHIPYSRGTVKFRKGDVMIIATLESKRLVEQGYKWNNGWKFFLLEYREG